MTVKTLECGESQLQTDGPVATFSTQRPASRNAMAMLPRAETRKSLPRRNRSRPWCSSADRRVAATSGPTVTLATRCGSMATPPVLRETLQ